MKSSIAKQGYRTTAQLLAKSARDSDAVSCFVNGVDWKSADCAIFVVKQPVAKMLYDDAVARSWTTIGKPVVDQKPSRPRCPTHDTVMCERFEQQGTHLIPTGEYFCFHCKE